MTIQDRSLMVRISGLRPGIDATAFIEVLKDTLHVLGEINKGVSPYGASDVVWEIVAAGMSSPLFATLQQAKTDIGNIAEYGPKVIVAFVRGVKDLQVGDDCPRLFNESALRALSAVTRTRAKGIATVEFSSNGDKVVATQAMSENANRAIQRLQLENAQKAGEIIEYGTIEGHLKELSELTDKDKMIIVDELTGVLVPCFFRRAEVEQKGRLAWKHRVSVAGSIIIDRATGNPKSVNVDDIRVMRGQNDLPQIEDLNGIDITGGIESSEYIRGLRDAE